MKKLLSLLLFSFVLNFSSIETYSQEEVNAQYPSFKSYMQTAYWTDRFEIDSILFHNNKIPLKPVRAFEGIDNLDKAIASFHSFNNSGWYKKLYTGEFYTQNADIFEEILTARLAKNYSKNAYYKKLLTIFFTYDSKKYAMCITESYFSQEIPFQKRTLIYENTKNGWLLIDGLPLNYLNRFENIKLDYVKLLLEKNSISNLENASLVQELKAKIFTNQYLELSELEANVTANPFDKADVIERKKKYAFMLADVNKPEPLRDESKILDFIPGFVLTSSSMMEYFESQNINFKPFVKYVKILKFDTPEDALASLFCHNDPELYKKYAIKYTPETFISRRPNIIQSSSDTINSGLSINYKLSFNIKSVKYVVVSYVIITNGTQLVRRYDRFIEKYDFATNKKYYVLDGEKFSYKIETLTRIFGSMNEDFLQCLFNNKQSDPNYPKFINKLIYKENKIDVCNFYYIYETKPEYFKNVLINLN